MKVPPWRRGREKEAQRANLVFRSFRTLHPMDAAVSVYFIMAVRLLIKYPINFKIKLEIEMETMSL